MIGKLFVTIFRARIDDNGAGIKNFLAEFIHLQDQLKSLRKGNIGDIKGETLFFQTFIEYKIHPG